MTPTRARWSLALAQQRHAEISSSLQQYSGRMPLQQEKELVETKTRLEWAIERCLEVISKDTVQA
jgi:hypothetical protein